MAFSEMCSNSLKRRRIPARRSVVTRSSIEPWSICSARRRLSWSRCSLKRDQISAPVPTGQGQLSSPRMHYPGVGNEIPLEERVRLGEITDSRRAVADVGSGLDDRLEDGLTGLLTETLISHARRRYLPGRQAAPSSGGDRLAGSRRKLGPSAPARGSRS